MPIPKLCLAGPALLALAGCTTVAELPGKPEYVASRVSRAFDCGLRVDRAGVMAKLQREERARFVAANAAYAVKSYNRPRACDAGERARVQNEVAALARR
jgi:hypothetical protein